MRSVRGVPFYYLIDVCDESADSVGPKTTFVPSVEYATIKSRHLNVKIMGWI